MTAKNILEVLAVSIICVGFCISSYMSTQEMIIPTPPDGYENLVKTEPLLIFVSA